MLRISEGIENCSRLSRADRHPARAAGSTSGLRTIELPADVCTVVIIADADPAG